MKDELTYERIVVHKVVELLRAHAERADNSAPVHRFLIIRDAALIYKIHHAVAEHLAMDTQILMITQQW